MLFDQKQYQRMILCWMHFKDNAYPHNTNFPLLCPSLCNTFSYSNVVSFEAWGFIFFKDQLHSIFSAVPTSDDFCFPFTFSSWRILRATLKIQNEADIIFQSHKLSNKSNVYAIAFLSRNNTWAFADSIILPGFWTIMKGISINDTSYASRALLIRWHSCRNL